MSAITRYKSIQEFKDQAPEAWKALQDFFEGDDQVDWKTIQGLADYIRCCDQEMNDEEVDSCYITQEYGITTDDETFRFSVTGSSYRKDQSVCDEEIDPSITVTDLTELEKEKTLKKDKKAQENIQQWADFFKDKSFEEVKEELSKKQFPKK